MRAMLTALALSSALAVPLSTAARAQDAGGWIEDPISGCAVWSVEAPQPGEGVSWAGACADGKANGHGTLTFWDESGLAGRYTGEMSGGKLDGEGRLYVRDDERGGFHRFLGRFADSRPSGPGFLTPANGARFYGELIDGIRHGRGVLVTADGWMVKGEIMDGKGVGTLVVDYTTDEGERYFGQAEDGQRNGFGVLTDVEGAFFAGRFGAGQPDGPGIYIGVGGNRYLGDFADGRRNGFGTTVDADGNVIQGRFVDGEPTGTLLVTLPDGTQSVTTWDGEGTE